MATRTALMGVAAGLAAMGAAADAGAQMRRVDAPWRVSAEVGGRWHQDAALDAFGATRSPPVTGLVVGRDLVSFGERTTLALEVNWNAETFSGRLREAMQTRMVAHTMTAALSVRWRLLWWLEPYARVGAGAAYSDVTLTPEAGASNGSDGLTGDAWTFAATAGAGVQVTTAAFLGPLRFATSIEGGYVLALSQGMSVRPQRLQDDAAEADRLPAAETNLGSVNLSGAYLQWMIGFRF